MRYPDRGHLLRPAQLPPPVAASEKESGEEEVDVSGWLAADAAAASAPAPGAETLEKAGVASPSPQKQAEAAPSPAQPEVATALPARTESVVAALEASFCAAANEGGAEKVEEPAAAAEAEEPAAAAAEAKEPAAAAEVEAAPVLAEQRPDATLTAAEAPSDAPGGPAPAVTAAPSAALTREPRVSAVVASLQAELASAKVPHLTFSALGFSLKPASPPLSASSPLSLSHSVPGHQSH